MARINNSVTKIAVDLGEPYSAIYSQCLQKIAFRNGFKWKEAGATISHIDKPVLTFNFNTRTIGSATSDINVGKLANPCQEIYEAEHDFPIVVAFLEREPKLFSWVDDGEVSVSGNVAEVVDGGVKFGCTFVPRDDVFRVANLLAYSADIAQAKSAFKSAGENVLEDVE